MADNVTAGTKAAGFDRAAGFGSTEQKTDNSDQIRDLLDQVQELMIEDGADPATAEALTNYARPASITLSGNLADLNRMGSIATQGVVHTPPGQPDIEATDINEAFAEPPAPDLNTGLQTPMGQIDAEGKATGANVGDGGDTGTADAGAEVDSDEGADLESMTKAELVDEAGRRDIEVSSSWSKQEIIDRINEG